MQDVGNLLKKADAAGVFFLNPMPNEKTASNGSEKLEIDRDKNAVRTGDVEKTFSMGIDLLSTS